MAQSHFTVNRSIFNRDLAHSLRESDGRRVLSRGKISRLPHILADAGQERVAKAEKKPKTTKKNQPELGIMKCILFLLCCLTLVPATTQAEPQLDKVDLFEAGKDGYALYRIPGVVATP